ncbi:methyl-accepting chemotaxis protein [Eleftheria terrae]|uniref:methyl-accepting chemotaxis protein n=1 Tax=Eleftheria terrae TaxID=1597781 RepID=UPI00263BC091|nr:methyl-accepting chemotaxis protein [Eleftheria terrae]
MKFFNNLRIGSRLALSFGLVVLLMLVSLALSLVNVAGIKDLVVEAGGPQARRHALMAEWQQNIAVNGSRALAQAMSSDAALSAEVANEVKATTARTSELIKEFTELETSAEGKALQAALGEARSRYLRLRDEMFKAKESGDAAALAQAMARFRDVTKEYLASANRLLELQDQRVKDGVVATVHKLDATRWINLVAVGINVVLALALGGALRRSIVRPLGEAQQAAARIATGDLTGQLSEGGRDETGQLGRSLSTMHRSLRGMVGDIRQASESIRVASSEVASGSEDLSRRTEQAASSLQETASSMEQLAVTVAQSAEASRRASELATSAAEVARRGGAVVDQVVSTMDEINDSSKRIADIIGVIDGIAFQTNILALNAAVEAARAGEQGRGFAVVASEVRSLAGRSAQAAKEIKGLIGLSVDRVETGAALVNGAGATMREIVASVQQVTDMIAEISAASSEQADGIGHVKTAVDQLDQMTQQNAALVEQSSAAADSLKAHAMQLARAVESFRLGAGNEPAVAG